jgi:glycerol-3-phosphate cytidylyltransferase-like family protein
MKSAIWATDCPHCKFISETFKNAENSTDREYWLMTEVFVYLHGSDVCSMTNNKINSKPNKMRTQKEIMVRFEKADDLFGRQESSSEND